MKTHRQCVHFIYKLASRAHIYVEQTCNTPSNSNIKIYYLFNPPVHTLATSGKILTQSAIESRAVLLCPWCFCLSFMFRAFCHHWTGTRSHFSCYYTLESVHVHTHVHTHVHAHTHTDTHNQQSLTHIHSLA